MMMRHLLLDSFNKYDENETIPIFIPLKDFDGSMADLFEYIYVKLRSIDESVSKNATAVVTMIGARHKAVR